eukprot:SAG11_NODE_1554_length_4695_cov_1.527633_3_plen_229_part_00
MPCWQSRRVPVSILQRIKVLSRMPRGARPRQVFEPFLDMLSNGTPISTGQHNSLGRSAKLWVEHWPANAREYLDPLGNPPPKDGLWRQRTLHSMFERLLAVGEAAGAGATGEEAVRQAEIAAMRREWSRGFVAEAIVKHCRKSHKVLSWRMKPGDAITEQRGLITMEDMAGFSAKIEPALTYDYKGWTVGKCGPWSQGPVFLQCLALLKVIERRGSHLCSMPLCEDHQ